MNPLESLELQLGRVQKAIAAIEEGAQEYSIDNRRLTKADLRVLYQREADLKAAILDRDCGSRTYAQMGMQ